MPYLFITTLAGGANCVYLLSTAQRTARYIGREHQAYSIAFGGTMIAAFVGVIVVTSLGQYAALPLSTLQDAINSPRLLMGGVANLLHQTGLPLQWSALWVMLVFLGCALGALDTAVRLGMTLIHNIYFHANAQSKLFTLDKLLSAFLTVIAALLLTNITYQALWPLFGAVSLGLCATAMLPVIVWVKSTGRRVWMLIAPTALLGGFSLYALGASLLAQLEPESSSLLNTDTLVLHIIVSVLLLVTMIHALTGVGRPPRDTSPQEDAPAE